MSGPVMIVFEVVGSDGPAAGSRSANLALPYRLPSSSTSSETAPLSRRRSRCPSPSKTTSRGCRDRADHQVSGVRTRRPSYTPRMRWTRRGFHPRRGLGGGGLTRTQRPRATVKGPRQLVAGCSDTRSRLGGSHRARPRARPRVRRIPAKVIATNAVELCSSTRRSPSCCGRAAPGSKVATAADRSPSDSRMSVLYGRRVADVVDPSLASITESHPMVAHQLA